jgi:hypothetical protein
VVANVFSCVLSLGYILAPLRPPFPLNPLTIQPLIPTFSLNFLYIQCASLPFAVNMVLS